MLYEVITLERFDMSAADKRKLEAWKELVNGAGDVFTAAQCNEEVAARQRLQEAPQHRRRRLVHAVQDLHRREALERNNFV